MKKRSCLWTTLGVVVMLTAGLNLKLRAGEASEGSYKVLAPIRSGNLVIFPVISSHVHDTSQFLSLEEGLRSGEVVVSEMGGGGTLIRPRHSPLGQPPMRFSDGAQVNRLVLVNNSKRPLLLLAGEIVTGGKQDRVIGKDRLVAPESDPIDLSVFCVEPGRWVARSDKFQAPPTMVQPSVRAKAMAEKNQSQVWEEVGKSRAAIAGSVSSSSYAALVEDREAQQKIDSVAAPVERDYQNVIGQLREKNAVGVVVAVRGELIWADVFASTKLLEKYWPKLVRSYAAESLMDPAGVASVDLHEAQAFLDHVQGKRQVVENEPGLFRHTEVAGDGFRVFALTSLLPGTGFDLHVAKMAD
jgi:hypothetical protein